MSADPYVLRREQWVDCPLNKVFAFFSEAHNLERITPPWLGFKILSISTGSMREGTEIDYRLRLHGIPIHWRTEILEWDPPYSFVDLQRSGPYRLWRHTHRFEAIGDRTRMLDEVRYALPFGALGRVVHALGDVQRIFDYRRQRIDKLFGEQSKNAT